MKYAMEKTPVYRQTGVSFLLRWLLIITLLSGNSLSLHREKLEKGQNNWLDGNNIYACLGSDKLPSSSTINNLGVDVFIWEPAIKDLIDSIHAIGKKAVPVVLLIGTVMTSYADWVKEAYGIDLIKDYPCIDVAGNPIPFDDPLKLGEGMVTICRCLFRQKYRKALRKIVVSQGVPVEPDGVMIDDISGFAVNVNSNMDEMTMADFRKYLKKRHSKKELKTKFGITNIGSFNYRKYLVDQGIYSVYLDPNPDLRDEFRKFLLVETKKEIKKLTKYTKRKIKNSYISGNVYGLWPEQHAFVPHLDFLTFENSFFTQRIEGWIGKEDFKFFGLYKLGKVVGGSKPVVVVPDVFDFGYLCDKKDYSYYRIFLAEAFAVRENFLVAFDALAEGGRQYTVKEDILSPYTKFIKNHGSVAVKSETALNVSHSPGGWKQTAMLFEVKDWAEVGVLYDWYQGFRDTDTHYYFLKVTTALQEGQWLFDVIYVGDKEINNVFPSLKDIEDYEAIVVPYSSSSLSAEASNLLAQYKNTGKSVVYIEEKDSKKDILTRMDSLGIDKIVNLENKNNISVSVYDADKDKTVIVFVNYNYNWKKKDFIKETKVKVTLDFPYKAKKVSLSAPEKKTSQALKFSSKKNTLTFTLPSHYVLGLVEIKH